MSGLVGLDVPRYLEQSFILLLCSPQLDPFKTYLTPLQHA